MDNPPLPFDDALDELVDTTPHEPVRNATETARVESAVTAESVVTAFQLAREKQLELELETLVAMCDQDETKHFRRMTVAGKPGILVWIPRAQIERLRALVKGDA